MSKSVLRNDSCYHQCQGDRAGVSKYIIGVCIVLSGALAVTLETVFVSWVMIADTVGLRDLDIL